MRMIEIDASDCGPEDVPTTPLLNALRLPHKLLLMKVEALRLIDGLNANGRRTAHSSYINITIAEFAEHAVMAARAAGEFSKAENYAPGLQLAIDCVFLNFLENKANVLGLL
nr:hypothetical protein [Tanacetum cinerariifolium]